MAAGRDARGRFVSSGGASRAKVTSSWHGQTLAAGINAVMEERVKMAAVYLTQHIIQSFPEGGGAVGTRGGYLTEAEGAVKRSQPGGIPFVQLGTLRRSIWYERVANALYKVGSRLQGNPFPYSVYLEFGTAKMAPRPYMRPGLYACQQAIVKMMTAPLAKLRGLLPTVARKAPPK